MTLKMSTPLKPQVSFNWFSVFYGTLLAVITSIILMVIGGTVMYYTIFNERLVPVLGLAILFASIFLGGFVSAKKAGKAGWLHGLSVGIIFLVFTILFSLVFPSGIFGFAVFKKVVAALLAGTLGGIWGVGQ